MMRESPLADIIPLWRTFAENATTVLVTPGLDYIGGLELGTLDVRFSGGDELADIGEGLRNLVGGLEDGTTLHFIYRVGTNIEDVIQEYEAICRVEDCPSLRAYVDARAQWLRERPLRRVRLYLFFSRGSPGGSVVRGQIGLPLVFRKSVGERFRERHEKEMGEIAKLRDRIAGRLAQHGIPSRQLDVEEVRRLHYELLNPLRAEQAQPAPQITLKEQLWNATAARSYGRHLVELTEAEQLCFEDLQDDRGYFRQGPVFRRVCTLKTLPESGTLYFAADPLLKLALPDRAGDPVPFDYTLAVTIQVQRQAGSRRLLSMEHTLVDVLSNIPFLNMQSVDREEADRAKLDSVRGLFTELNTLTSKIVSLSVSLLLQAKSLDHLEAQTEVARTAISRCGNSEFLVEDVTQIPGFLSMLPGGGPYQLRKRGCTSRNAADFTPAFAAWTGTIKPCSILMTPDGDQFRLDLQQKGLATAHHGLVIAETGAGKSFSIANIMVDALAAGAEAILVDNGGSWEPLTALFGGVHIPVDVNTSISPFGPYPSMLDEKGEMDLEDLQAIANFVQVCVTEPGDHPFDTLTTDLVLRAIRWCYETKFRDQPTARPLLGDFRGALREHPWENQDDKTIAEQVHRKLGPFCDGMYAAFCNRPSRLRHDARLLTFDLAKVSHDAKLKQVALACVINAVADRAANRKARHTIVAVDEAHEYLGKDDVAEQFLESAYRKMRKFGVSMWTISQALQDWLSSKAGPTIVHNSGLKILLRHENGHEEIAQYLNLPDGALAAFRNLSFRPGHYSDMLLQYGKRFAAVRLAPHPLAYWTFTTDKDEKTYIDRALEKNPHLSRLQVLQELAARHPNGLVGERTNATRRVA